MLHTFYKHVIMCVIQVMEGYMMSKKQWSTTYDENILKEFQSTCEEYGMKANVILEALMKFFSEGKCKLIIDKGGLSIEVVKE